MHRSEAAAFVGRRARNAEDAERVRRGLVRLFDMIAEQGHRPASEPLQQRRALGCADQACILDHPVLQRVPVAHREPHVFEHAPQVGRELLPAARIGAVELQVHHRFAAALVVAERLEAAQVTLGVAAGADDRVKQAVDGKLTGGDGIGD